VIPFELALFDGVGKELLRGDAGISNASLDMSSYKPGIYFLRITNGLTVQTFKIRKAD
jgi:hypothetical protein